MGALDSVIDNILQGIYSHKVGTKGILWTFIHVENHTASHIQIDRQTDISLIEKTCVINNNTEKIDMINICNCLRVFFLLFYVFFFLKKQQCHMAWQKNLAKAMAIQENYNIERVSGYLNPCSQNTDVFEVNFVNI